MSRPTVSVVMPFAGDAAAARTAVRALLLLETGPGDELILADNAGVAVGEPPVKVVRATGERSPAYARNAGAAHAHGEWILFLDADCRAPATLIDAYFSEEAGEDVGALAGEVVAAPKDTTLAGRYGAAKSFLSQEAHLAHPYRPRAVAANLMVRREAFEQVGGFYEGIRAAEDTDFSWRLQHAGWRLELRSQARVEHMYRATVRELRRQWRGYAAGRAWLARRYEGFVPEPAMRRGISRGLGRMLRRRDSPAAPAGSTAGRIERGRFLALDALLALDELTGLTMSNRPSRDSVAAVSAQVVLVADRFPAQGDPLVEFARALERARVEAVARPDVPAIEVARELRIEYREDDGAAARAAALLKLIVRHPLRCARDVLRRGRHAPGLSALAPAAIRLERDSSARVHALGGSEAHDTARRLAALAGRRLEDRDRPAQ